MGTKGTKCKAFFSKLFSVLLRLIFACSAAFIVFEHTKISGDVGRWLEMAELSNNPNDMYKYLSYAQEGMENWGMTEGHTVTMPFLKNPPNDMSLIYEEVIQRVRQAKTLTELSETTQEYQTGLYDIKDSIQKLRSIYNDTYIYWYYYSDGMKRSLLLIGSIGSLATYMIVGLLEMVKNGFR